MLGLMQNQQLLISSLIEFADRHHGEGEIVSRRVEVALGSGGARGYAHIGALQVLEDRGFEIVVRVKWPTRWMA